jgi:hypothetical protein
MGSGCIDPHFLDLGKLHAPAALPPGKEPPAPIGQEVCKHKTWTRYLQFRLLTLIMIARYLPPDLMYFICRRINSVRRHHSFYVFDTLSRPEYFQKIIVMV